MNYKKIYDSIITYRKSVPIIGYSEEHHIIPRCIGGLDIPENLIKLSGKEHYLCHLLLVKIYENSESYFQMVKAFSMMLYCHSTNQNRYISGKRYELLRQEFAKAQSTNQRGSKNSQFGTMWIYSLELKRNKKIKATDTIEDGWIKGRVMNFDKLSTKLLLQQQKELEKKALKLLEVEKYREYYRIYSLYGFNKFKELTSYPYTKQNLVMRFAYLLEEFIPQNGKQRG